MGRSVEGCRGVRGRRRVGGVRDGRSERKEGWGGVRGRRRGWGGVRGWGGGGEE